MPRLAALFANERLADPPAGWVPTDFPGGFSLLLGPIFARSKDGGLLLGFRCTERHLNEYDICHGGMIASLCDHQGFAAQAGIGFDVTIAPTITLGIDYLEPVRPGDWVTGEAQLLKLTRRMMFSTFRGQVEDRTVFQSRAIFRLRDEPDEHGAALMRRIEAAMTPDTAD